MIQSSSKRIAFELQSYASCAEEKKAIDICTSKSSTLSSLRPGESDRNTSPRGKHTGRWLCAPKLWTPRYHPERTALPRIGNWLLCNFRWERYTSLNRYSFLNSTHSEALQRHWSKSFLYIDKRYKTWVMPNLFTVIHPRRNWAAQSPHFFPYSSFFARFPNNHRKRWACAFQSLQTLFARAGHR